MTLVRVVDVDGVERYVNSTLEASRRRLATWAAKKCCAEAAAALARAGDHALLLKAAQTFVDAADVLQAATPETKGDAHIRLRVAACRWRAELASVETAGDNAAVARAHALGKASTAVADAARVVFAAESVAAELAARQQLKVAEDAFKPLEAARRPRPTSRTACRRPKARRVAGGESGKRVGCMESSAANCNPPKSRRLRVAGDGRGRRATGATPAS